MKTTTRRIKNLLLATCMSKKGVALYLVALAAAFFPPSVPVILGAVAAEARTILRRNFGLSKTK